MLVARNQSIYLSSVPIRVTIFNQKRLGLNIYDKTNLVFRRCFSSLNVEKGDKNPLEGPF
jgi:hypothetical protein